MNSETVRPECLMIDASVPRIFIQCNILYPPSLIGIAFFNISLYSCDLKIS